MSTIETKSNKVNRTIETERPRILESEITLDELIQSLGEEMAKKMIKDQAKVMFRSQIRNQLEKLDDNEDPAMSDDEIQAGVDKAWTPEFRQRKSQEEKVAESLGKLSQDELKAALAKAGIEV